MPSIGTRLHDLPTDVLHAIMARLAGNDVAKLASAHPALRRALGTLTSFHPSLMLEVTLDRGGARTRRDTAASRSHRRRRDDFGAFRAAHPQLAIEALTVRVALPAGVLRRRRSPAPVDWLPLQALKRLCIETSHIGNGCTEVSASLPSGQRAMALFRNDMNRSWFWSAARQRAAVELLQCVLAGAAVHLCGAASAGLAPVGASYCGYQLLRWLQPGRLRCAARGMCPGLSAGPWHGTRAAPLGGGQQMPSHPVAYLVRRRIGQTHCYHCPTTVAALLGPSPLQTNPQMPCKCCVVLSMHALCMRSSYIGCMCCLFAVLHECNTA